MPDVFPSVACPDTATLRALLDGTLPEDQQATTQAHVERCPTCEAALRQMTAGGESWIGMAEKLKGSRDEDPKLAAALERLKADDSSGGDSSEAADPQRTLDFLQPADDPKLLGKLGRHEISEVVGWGGMGVVLRAYDPSLHRVVAVKVLASHLAHHAVARKRFIREAQAAAAVCHDNVVTIHAIEEGGSQLSRSGTRESSDPTEFSRIPLQPQTLPKIIMQFVAGGSLQERIDQEAPLELKEILRIAMQTAAGLAAAHAQGVVHRDVKPANILLENGVQRVKLTDFGLARVMDDASLTLSGVIAGTPQYMAPEQAWGREVDARADLFSLGAVMYAMCSGHSPFRARTTMAVLKRVCEDAPRPLRAINPDVPAWLVAIIEKLLSKNPDDRFQTATEVSELLGRWLAHMQQPNVAPAPEIIAPRAFDEARRHPRTKSWVADPRAASAALAMNQLQRRPDELRHRLRVAALLGIALAVIAIPVLLWLLASFPSPGTWSPMDTLRNVTAALIVVTAVLVLLSRFARWLFDQDAAPVTVNRDAAMSDSDRTGSYASDQAPAGSQLSPRIVVIAMVVTGVLLAFFSISVLESNPRDLGGFLGFSLIQLLASFALAGAFRAAWNTSRWVTWIGVLLFLPFLASFFGYLASNGEASGALQFFGGLQALTAMAYEFALLFVRPLFPSASSERTSDRFTGWKRLITAASVVLILLAGGSVMRLRIQETLLRDSLQIAATEREALQRELNEARQRQHSDFANRSQAASPSIDAGTSTVRGEVPQALKGRWVVLSSEGASLNSAAPTNDPFGSPFAAAPAMGTASSGSPMAGGMGMAGAGASAGSSPLQWIEFADDHVVVFDGRETKLVAEFSTDADIEPKRLSLRHPSFPAPDAGSDWRYGIYRLERDRLIVC